jgi:adenylate kinase family enzyme
VARKIAVIGTASSSGKTTIAAELASRHGVPHVELDALHHGPNWTEATPEEFRERVDAALIGPDGWVVDGQYFGKIGLHVLDQADLIVWLDLPMRVWLPRLLRRTYSRIRGNVRLWNDNRETWRGSIALITFAVRNSRRRRKEYPQRLAHLEVVRLRSDAEIRRWLKTQPAGPE